MLFEHKKSEITCCFCTIKKSDIIFESELAYIYKDQSPVTKEHSLVIPKRHFANLFDASQEEILAIWDLLKLRKLQILSTDNSVDGFNVGINVGVSAGQSVFHLHVHLIPRRNGDTENPKGGVRGVIPSKMNY